MTALSLTPRFAAHFLSLSSTSGPRRHHLLLIRLSSSFPTASWQPPFSASPQGTPYRHEENRSIRVSVWWDFENCPVPCGANAFKVGHFITSAVRTCGIRGPIQITGFGDVFQLPRTSHEALSATGITLTHVAGGKNNADRSLLIDLMYWVAQNPPPAHLFLISGDSDFAGCLHRLRLSNYNILLAGPESAPSVLCSASSIMWHWSTLARGENIVGRYFNQPPVHSWYGHYKVALEDPYALNEQSSSQQPEDSSDCETVVRPVPKDLARKIQRIVNSYPDGILIKDFRSELTKNDVVLDKDYYGYKKFSSFLFSVPYICRLKRFGGQYLVRPASPKFSGPVECTPSEKQDPSSSSSESDEAHIVSSATNMAQPEMNNDLMTAKATDMRVPSSSKIETFKKENEKPVKRSEGIGNPEFAASSIAKQEINPLTESTKLRLPLSPPAEASEKEKKYEMASKNKKKGVEASKNEKKGEATSKNKKKGEVDSKNEKKGEEVFDKERSDSSAVEYHNLAKEHLGDKVCDEVIGDHVSLLEKQDSAPKMGFFKRLWNKWFGKKNVDLHMDKDTNPDNTVHSFGIHEAISAKESNAEFSTQSVEELASSSSSNKVSLDSKSHAKDSPQALSDPSSRVLNQMDKSKRDELFLMDSFWTDIESFLKTKEGSIAIDSSMTREEVAQNLRMKGPLVIQPLEESDLLQLVDLLISEKKLIEECPLKSRPFRVVQCNEKGSQLAQPLDSNQLRSILLDLSSPSDSGKQPEREGKERNQGSVGTTKKKPSERSRNVVFADCRKLFNELLKEMPEGVNIGYFKIKFVERYGYILDYRKLGFKSLPSLLENFLEVKAVGNYILPATASTKPVKDIGLSELFGSEHQLVNSSDKEEEAHILKEEENGSPWEELGPVERRNPERSGVNDVGYESPLSDDEDLSDYGEQTSECKGEVQRKMIANGDDSSLLQVLDSWYVKQEKNDDMINLSRAFSKLENVPFINERKPRPSKSYSFVADDSDELSNGMLGSLRKPGEIKRMGS